MPWVDKERCAGCGRCVTMCPVQAITLLEGKAEIDHSKCIKCGTCVRVCPQGAIRPGVENRFLRRGFRRRFGRNLKQWRE